MTIIFEYEYAFEEEQNLNFQEYVDFVQMLEPIALLGKFVIVLRAYIGDLQL